MDELEARIFALELLLSERLALDPPGVHLQLEANLREGLDEAGPEERQIRQQALDWLKDARARFDVFTTGIRIVKPD